MGKINWAQIVVFALVVLVVFLFGASLLSSGGGWGFAPMMGPGMMGRWGFGPFAWISMLFWMIVPLGLLILLALGVVWLVQQGSRSATPPERICSNCKRPLQSGWQLCPYCGQKAE